MNDLIESINQFNKNKKLLLRKCSEKLEDYKIKNEDVEDKVKKIKDDLEKLQSIDSIDTTSLIYCAEKILEYNTKKLSELSSVEIMKINDFVNSFNTYPKCKICNQNLEYDSCSTKCGHIFHFYCIVHTKKCPICNINVEHNEIKMVFL